MNETLWGRLFRGARRLRQLPLWTQFAGPDWAEHIMEVSVRDRFHAKQGRTIARWTLRSEEQELVVYLKRHYRLPWWRGLLALLWPEGCWSPALQEWNHLEWARARGLPVPRAVAAGEYIGPWARLRSFLAVEELTGMLPLHQAVPLAGARLGSVDFCRWKRGLVEEMARLTQELHQGQWFHKDLYLCHFYIAEEDTGRLPDWRGAVRLIDLHRLAQHRWSGLWWRAKDLAQLLYSSDVPGVSLRDRLHFWRVYLAGTSLGWRTRWLRWGVQVRSWNYRQHQERKKKGTQNNTD